MNEIYDRRRPMLWASARPSLWGMFLICVVFWAVVIEACRLIARLF